VRWLRKLAIYGSLTAWSLVCLLPLYWVVLASIKSENAIIHGPRYLPFVDFTPSGEAWRFIVLDSHESLLPALFNSLVVSTAATLIIVASTCLLLYAVTRLGTAQKWLITLTLATRILPPATVVIALYMMAQQTGLLDTRSALVLTYAAVNLPVATWLLFPAFGLRATEQEEAAVLEGAKHLFILWDVVTPMIMQSLAAVSLIVFVLCWNEYLFAAILTTDHASTLSPWMAGQLSMKEAQVGGEPEEWAHLSAATVLMAAPLLLFTGVAMRQLLWRSAAR
jgi:multiple sugar transport system permease protein